MREPAARRSSIVPGASQAVWFSVSLLDVALIISDLMARVANLGVQNRHWEIRADNSPPAATAEEHR